MMNEVIDKVREGSPREAIVYGVISISLAFSSGSIYQKHFPRRNI